MATSRCDPPPEVVAAIACALAMMLGGQPVRVREIRAGGPSAWAQWGRYRQMDQRISGRRR